MEDPMTGKQPFTWRQQLGMHYENAALRYLQARGFAMVCSNYRCKFGEIDLVMLDAATLVFVEVRYRRSSSHGTAAATVDGRKQGRIRLAARKFLFSNPQFRQHICRFDVLAIEAPTTGKPAINWIPNAFY